MVADLPPCHVQIAEHYNVPADLLQAIHATEGGRPGLVVGPNKNGTFDYGDMQINSAWLDFFQGFGVQPILILNDTCTNVMAAAYILAKEHEHLGSWKYAIGSYNAGPKNAAYATGYITKVMFHWQHAHR